MNINNETVGISAEIAIAHTFGLKINPLYENRSDQTIVRRIQPCVRTAFTKNNIPTPIKHIAEGNNPVDFILTGNKTLSVKTNQKNLNRVAPTGVGQPTQNTYFKHMGHELDCDLLSGLVGEDTYENRARLFKEISMTKITEVLNVYWKHTFYDCDYMIHFYNVLNFKEELKYTVYERLVVPNWDIEKLSFSQTPDSWKECCTLYYKGHPIGVFQAHNHRKCFKFRFNLNELSQALNT